MSRVSPSLAFPRSASPGAGSQPLVQTQATRLPGAASETRTSRTPRCRPEAPNKTASIPTRFPSTAPAPPSPSPSTRTRPAPATPLTTQPSSRSTSHGSTSSQLTIRPAPLAQPATLRHRRSQSLSLHPHPHPQTLTPSSSISSLALSPRRPNHPSINHPHLAAFPAVARSRFVTPDARSVSTSSSSDLSPSHSRRRNVSLSNASLLLTPPRARPTLAMSIHAPSPSRMSSGLPSPPTYARSQSPSPGATIDRPSSRSERLLRDTLRRAEAAATASSSSSATPFSRPSPRRIQSHTPPATSPRSHPRGNPPQSSGSAVADDEDGTSTTEESDDDDEEPWMRENFLYRAASPSRGPSAALRRKGSAASKKSKTGDKAKRASLTASITASITGASSGVPGRPSNLNTGSRSPDAPRSPPAFLRARSSGPPASTTGARSASVSVHEAALRARLENVLVVHERERARRFSFDIDHAGARSSASVSPSRSRQRSPEGQAQVQGMAWGSPESLVGSPLSTGSHFFAPSSAGSGPTGVRAPPPSSGGSAATAIARTAMSHSRSNSASQLSRLNFAIGRGSRSGSTSESPDNASELEPATPPSPTSGQPQPLTATSRSNSDASTASLSSTGSSARTGRHGSPITPPPTPPFDARSASALCRRMDGYVSFASVEGLGVPPELLDPEDDEDGKHGKGRWGGKGMGGVMSGLRWYWGGDVDGTGTAAEIRTGAGEQ